MNKVKLGDIIQFNPSESIKKGSTAKKIPMEKLLPYTKKISSFENAIYSTGPKFKNNDTLLAKITPCLENGKTAFVDILDKNEIAFGSSEFIVLRAIKNISDANYIYYLARSPKFRNRAIGCMEGTSGRKRVNDKSLQNEIFEIPNIKTQTVIARVLSSLDDKIELNNKINKELENLAKTIYEYWFVQFDFPNKNGKPYKISGEKMVYNEELKREIPEGWEVKKIDEVALLQYGYPFDTRFFNDEQRGLPVIRIRDVLENTISSYTMEKNIDKKYELNIGDLLIGMDGNFHINHWYRAGCYLNQRLVRVRKNELSTFVIKYQIEPYIKLKENACSGSTVGHLSDKDVKALNIVVPPQNLRDKFNEQFDRILSKILSTQNEVQNLAKLRDFLLPLLMNGQVKVNIKNE